MELDRSMAGEITRVLKLPLAESTLYFPVAERDLGWHNIVKDAWEGIEREKALVRKNTEGGGTWLANVGRDYKLVTNRDLYVYIEETIVRLIPEAQRANLLVREHQSHGGRDCYKEYIFQDITCDIGDGGDVHFRIIVGNSYGARAVSLLYGAIDYWCANGMVIGQSDKQVRKHTSGLTLNCLDEWIEQGIEKFTTFGKQLWKWNHTDIGDDERVLQLFEYLDAVHVLSKKLGSTIFNDMMQEMVSRIDGTGVVRSRCTPNLWHLYSALTQWATHGEVRDTGNDHEANTRIQRGLQVTRIMEKADAWLEAQVSV